MKYQDVLTYTGGALAGTLGAHAIYAGVRSMIGGGDYAAAGAELVTGILITAFTHAPLWRVIGGVFIAQGILDFLYAGQVLKVQL